MTFEEDDGLGKDRIVHQLDILAGFPHPNIFFGAIIILLGLIIVMRLGL